MAKNQIKVSIIIINWNGLKDTVDCLESLKRITYPNYDVIVVDNASKGDDVKMLRERFDDYIHLIQNDKNSGYSGGNNIGAKYALANSDPDYLLILNNDTVVDHFFLDHLLEIAESDASIGITGPKVYFYQPDNLIQAAGSRINMWTGHAFSIGCREIDVGQYEIKQEVDYIFGCCLLIKKEVTQKIGLFDESYFCYWDDADYCTRAKKAGHRIVYVPEARLWHKNPVKQRILDKTPTTGRSSGLPFYFRARNSFNFMRKNATRLQYSSFLVYFFGWYFWYMALVCLVYHRDFNRFIGLYRGTKDGLLQSEAAARFYIGH